MDGAILAQLPLSAMCINPRVGESACWGDEDEQGGTWDPVVSRACSFVSQIAKRWQTDFQKEHTPNSLVSSFKVMVTGSVYMGIDGENSDIDLVVLIPAHRGIASVRAIMEERTGFARYFREEGVHSIQCVENSRVPILTFQQTPESPEVDISFAVVPRDAVCDWDTTIDGLGDMCLDGNWKDAESLRVVIGLLGTRIIRARATESGRYETWRRAAVVVREMARSMGVLSNMCRLLSSTAICVATLKALETTGPTGGLAEVISATISLLCPPRSPEDGGALVAVHIYDPHTERAPDSMCSWRTSLQSDSRADAFLLSGAVHPFLADTLQAHLRSADQAIGPRCLCVWYPTRRDTDCCTVLITHSVGLAQYVTIYNALTACRRRIEGREDPLPLFSGDGVLYGHVLNCVRIEGHPKQAVIVMALAQLIDDIAYDSHRSVHAALWPTGFSQPGDSGAKVYYLAVRGVPGRCIDLRLDALLYMRLSLCGIANIMDVVSIQTYNPTACTTAEREWVDRAVFTYPRTVMPWPPAARRSQESPRSPRD
jgi:hypothetical protein